MDGHVVVLPGDIVTDLLKSEKSPTFRLGPGLRQESERVIACKCGVLRRKDPNVYWIDNHQKRVSFKNFNGVFLSTVFFKFAAN